MKPPSTPPAERVWLKHKRNGQTGYLVDKGGVTKVKLDGPDPFALRPYRAEDWEPMGEASRVPRMAIAHIQWAADRALLRALGDHRAAARDWHELTTEQRIAFMDKGPGKRHAEHRKKLWDTIKEATRELVE